MKRTSILVIGLILISVVCVLLFAHVGAATYNYQDCIEKAAAWYDANRCGTNVATNNIFSSWRGACHTGDAVNGGFHDAGDHVKFQLPAAFAFSEMAWSMLEFPGSWDSTAMTKGLQEMKIFTDYSLAGWDGTNVCVQIGDGGTDHAYWGPPELETVPRPEYTNNCSDIVSETAAALAAMSIVYKSTSSSYASQCLSAAEAMFTEVTVNPSTVSTVANGYYTSGGAYEKDIWAAVWLYKATGNTSYLANLPTWFIQPNATNDNPWEKQWTQCWDDQTLGTTEMYYGITGNINYYNALVWNFTWYSTTLSKTPYGLPYLNSWANNRYDCAEAGLMFAAYKDYGINYLSTANMMVDYSLGSNPTGICFLTNYPTTSSNAIHHPHHRANQPNQNNSFTNGMLGALAGGTDSGDGVDDEVTNYTDNEVALDYEASFLMGCAGRLYVANGGVAGSPMPTPSPARLVRRVMATVYSASITPI